MSKLSTYPTPLATDATSGGRRTPRRWRAAAPVRFPLPPLILTGFVTAAMAVLTVATLAHQSLVQGVRANEAVSHTFQVLRRLDEALASVNGAESAQRGYYITGDEGYLPAWRQARRSLPPLLDELRGLTKDNPTQRDNLAELGRLIQARMGRLEEDIALQRRGERAAVQKRIESGLGAQLMEQVRAQVEEIKKEELRLLELRDTTARRLAWNDVVVVMGGSALLLVLVMMAAWLVARELHARELAVRARDEFLSIASHELKTPLTSLGLQLELIAKLAGGLDAGQAALLTSRLQTSRRQLRRLDLLIKSLLDVSRLTSGRLELVLQEADLAPMLRDLAERFSDDFARAGSELQVAVEAPLPGKWDPLRVEQMVGGLLSNALKYGAGKPVELSARAQDGFGVITVRDQGLGIPPENLERIFDKYERGVSRNYGGLGLGLYIVREAAEAMGGTVKVESRPGEGATFTLRLPQHAEAAGAPELRPP